MAINGLLTDVGLTQSQIALNNQGWFIFPTRFEVADTAGVFSKTRVGARIWEAATAYAVGDLVVPTTPGFGFYFIVSVAGTSGGSEPNWPTSPGSVVDGGVTWDFVGATTGGLETIWFAAAISTRIEAPPNTLEIVLTIPPGADPSNRDIEEIYIFAEDQNQVEFLLAIGQPDATITYDKDGTTSLRLAITLTNVNISGLFVFKYTQATEIAEHSVDPNAHPDIRDILQLQFNLAANGDMGVDRNTGGFDMSGKTFGFGPADWEGQLTADGAVSGTLIRKTTSAIEGGRSMHFSGIGLAGGNEELHVRKKIRGDTARLLSNNPWSASTAYVVGDIVVPTASPLLRFRVTIAGTSDSSEPTWPTLAGDNIVDGGVTWEAILGNFSMSWEAFQDTGATQFAIITLSTPDALDDFAGSSTTLLTSGATDHPMLDGVVTTVERAAIVLPNVDNGLLIDIQVDTGALSSSENFEFSRFKFEPTEKVSPYLSPPHIWEQIASSGYLEDLLDFQITIGTQAQVDAGRASNTINTFAAEVANGDRILVLDGTHTLTAPVAITEDDVHIVSLSPLAIIAFGAHTFTASGARNVINIRTSGAGAGDVIVSGDGTILTALDTALTAIAHSGGAMAIATGLLGGIKRGSTTAPGHDQELVDRQYVQSLGLVVADITVGTQQQVDDGDASNTVDTFVAAISDGDRVLIKDGVHGLVRDEDITENDVEIRGESPDAILSLDSWTLTFSGARGVQRIYLTAVGTNALIYSGSEHQAMIIIDTPPADPLDDSGLANFIVINDSMWIDGTFTHLGASSVLTNLLIAGSLKLNVTILSPSTTQHTVGNEAVIISNAAGDVQIDLPAASDGLRHILIKNISPTSTMTIQPQSGDLIDDQINKVVALQYEPLQVQSDLSDWWLFGLGSGSGTGDLTQEDLLYALLLNGGMFRQIHFDKFTDSVGIDEGGSPIAVFNPNTNAIDGVIGSLVEIPESLAAGALPAGNAKTFFKFFVHVEADLIFNERSTVDCEDDVSDSLDGTYLVLHSALDAVLYHVWISTSGGSAVDPAPAGSTPIPVTITTNDNAIAVATAMESAFSGFTDFNVSRASDVVTIENTKNGPTTNIADSSSDPTGFGFSTLDKGGFAEYSLDGGGPSGGSGGWIAFDMERVVTITLGFTTLHIRFTWLDTGALNSIGILYDETGLGYQPATRFRVNFTVTSGGLAIDAIVTLPGLNVYTVGFSSLQLYENGTLLYDGIDYQENDNRSVKMLKALSEGTILQFTEFFGPVDTSVENQARLNFEHTAGGSHVFRSRSVTDPTSTILGTDDTVYFDGSAAHTATLPSAVGIQGHTLNFKRRMAFLVTLNAQSGETIDGATSKTLTVLNESLTMRSDGTNWNII